VPPDELLEWVCRADVSGVLIGRSTLNHYLSTPNKLFESIAAGVPVVASDFPAMRPIVCDDPEGPLGLVVDPGDLPAIVLALRSILEQGPDDRAALRERCRSAAHDHWNWEQEAGRLVSLYGELVASGADGPR
jgi:glycosyltransferase involved in cell wall biosynthesis